MTRTWQQRAGKRQRGVTLTELLVTIAIIGILASIAIPSYRDNIERSRLKQAVEALKSDMQFARAEAIKRSVNVHVSRLPAAAGAWCYGLRAGGDCDCTEIVQTAINFCDIKIVSGVNFSNSINMDSSSAANNNEFDFRRGTTDAGGVTFSTENYQAKVDFSEAGRIIICTPSGAEGLPGYPDC